MYKLGFGNSRQKSTTIPQLCACASVTPWNNTSFVFRAGWSVSLNFFALCGSTISHRLPHSRSLPSVKIARSGCMHSAVISIKSGSISFYYRPKLSDLSEECQGIFGYNFRTFYGVLLRQSSKWQLYPGYLGKDESGLMTTTSREFRTARTPLQIQHGTL